MAGRFREPTIHGSFRHSVSDFFVLAGVVLLIGLYFWTPFTEAAKSGRVVQVMMWSKPYTAGKPHAGARLMPVQTPRKTPVVSRQAP